MGIRRLCSLAVLVFALAACGDDPAVDTDGPEGAVPPEEVEELTPREDPAGDAAAAAAAQGEASYRFVLTSGVVERTTCRPMFPAELVFFFDPATGVGWYDLPGTEAAPDVIGGAESTYVRSWPWAGAVETDWVRLEMGDSFGSPPAMVALELYLEGLHVDGGSFGFQIDDDPTFAGMIDTFTESAQSITYEGTDWVSLAPAARYRVEGTLHTDDEEELLFLWLDGDANLVQLQNRTFSDGQLMDYEYHVAELGAENPYVLPRLDEVTAWADVPELERPEIPDCDLDVPPSTEPAVSTVPGDLG